MSENNAEPAASDVVTIKAHAVMTAANLNPHAFDPTTIISIILALFQALAACKPPTPAPAPPSPTPPGTPTAAQVHQSISRPTIIEMLELRDATRKHVKNPSLVSRVMRGVLTVGAGSTQDETSAMFVQAVGYPPA